MGMLSIIIVPLRGAMTMGNGKKLMATASIRIDGCLYLWFLCTFARAFNKQEEDNA